MIGNLKNRFARAFSTKGHQEVWKSDPLMHPDIRNMDLNQVADLPMWAGRRQDDGARLHPRNDTVCGSHGRYGGTRCLLAAFLAALLLAETFWASTDALAESPGKLATFAMPADFEQWHPDILGKNGAYRFRQVDGKCQVTFAQNRGANAARAAGQNPSNSLNAYIDRLAAQVGRLERTEAGTLGVRSGANERVSFISMEFAYMGNDKIEYHNRISGAWVGDIELLIIAACPVSEWLSGRLSIDAFIDKVSISHISGP